MSTRYEIKIFDSIVLLVKQWRFRSNTNNLNIYKKFALQHGSQVVNNYKNGTNISSGTINRGGINNALSKRNKDVVTTEAAMEGLGRTTIYCSTETGNSLMGTVGNSQQLNEYITSHNIKQ